MICRYSCFLNINFLFLLSFIFLSCGFSQNKNSELKGQQSDYYYPKIALLRDAQKELSENIFQHNIILEGIYTNCVGKVNGDIWMLSLKAEVFEKKLMVKKGDNECLLNLTNIKILKFGQIENITLVNRNLSLENPKEYLLIDSFFKSPIFLDLKDPNEPNKLEYIYLNIGLQNHDFLNTPKIKIVISGDLNLQNLEKEVISGRVYLSVNPDDRSNEMKMEFGSIGFKKYILTNDGDFPIRFKGFSDNNIYNNTCGKNMILNKGDSCSTDLLLTSRNLVGDKFKLSVNYSYNNEFSLLKNAKSHIVITGLSKENAESSNSLKGKYIYRLYQIGDTIFAANNSHDYKGLFYSKNGPNGTFMKVEGIDDNIEIRGVTAIGETIYAIAYNGKSGSQAIGGLFYSKYKNGKYHFERVAELAAKDVLSISSNGNTLYVSTKENGLYYFKNGDPKLFQKVNFKNWDTKSKQYISNVFVFDNHVFATSENVIYYSKNAYEANFSIPGSELNLNGGHITSVAMSEDKIFIGSSNGLYITDTKLSRDIYKVDELGDNEVYDMKSVGNSIYVATVCNFRNSNEDQLKLGCKKSGVFYSDLSIFPRFKKISSLENTFGISVSGGTVYITTSSGIHYLGNHFPKEVSVDSDSLGQNFTHSHFNEDILYLLKSGVNGGIFFSKNAGKDVFQKKRDLNLPSGSVIKSLNSFKDNFYAIVDNPQEKKNGIWYSKNGNNLFFNNISNFSEQKLTSIFPTEDKIYVSSENYILYAPSDILSNFRSNFKYLSNFYFNKKIRNIYVANDVMYVAAEDGLYHGNLKSENVLFKKVYNIVQNLDVKSIFVSGNSIYLATNKGLWYSNSGINGIFQRVNAFGEETINSVSVIGNMVYVIKSEGVFSVIISDYVNGFSNNLNGSIVKNVFAFRNKVIAATNHGVSISKDGGRSFKNIILGSISNSCNSAFISKGIIYVGTANGLFQSKDDGESFNELLSPYTIKNSINYIVENDNIIYFSTDSGLFYLNKNSESILPVESKIFNGDIIKKLFSSDQRIYAITAKGKMFSSEDGLRYSPYFAEILQDKKITSVFSSNNEIYIGTNKGLVVSKDGGISFRFITKEGEGLSGNEINGIYKVGSILYIATNMGLSISTDGGESFSIKKMSHGLGSNLVHDIFVQLANIPGFSLGVYAATENGLAISEM